MGAPYVLFAMEPVSEEAAEPSLAPDYIEMLYRIGRVSSILRERHSLSVVLVGGAAVELYTGGAYQSGDFDIVSPDSERFEDVLMSEGFQRNGGVGQLSKGWFHPDVPRYSVELVSGPLFDGFCERYRCKILTVAEGSSVTLPPVEDLIADRLGQFCSQLNRTDDSTLQQARMLLSLAETVDWAYLKRRVAEDAGDISLLVGVRPDEEGGL